MNEFLKTWDGLMSDAKSAGDCGYLWTYNGPALDPMEVANRLRLTARTMHPSFMSVPTTKHDPERDQ